MLVLASIADLFLSPPIQDLKPKKVPFPWPVAALENRYETSFHRGVWLKSGASKGEPWRISKCSPTVATGSQTLRDRTNPDSHTGQKFNPSWHAAHTTRPTVAGTAHRWTVDETIHPKLWDGEH
jgi:hypothetical protein